MIGKLKKQLKHERAALRAEALRELIRIGSDEARRAVSKELKGQEDWFKRDALKFLAGGDIQHLLPLLRDPDGAIRKLAYAAARAMGDDAVREAARISLADRDAVLRRRALEWVFDFTDDETQQLFEQALSDRKPDLALRWFREKWDAKPKALAAFFDRARGKVARELLSGYVAEISASDLRKVIGWTKNRKLVFDTIQGRTDFQRIVSWTLRKADESAALVAIEFAEEDVVWTVLEHESPSLRIAAIDKLGPEAAAGCITDAHEKVRWRAVTLLLQEKSLHLAERDPLLRMLVKVAEDRNRATRRMAADALIQLDDRDRIVQLSETDDKIILRKVAHALDERGDERCLVPMIRLAEECRGEVAKKARDRIPELELGRQIELLRHKRGAVRKYSARLLEAVTDERAIEPLLKAVDDESYEVQLSVVNALRNFIVREDVQDRMIQCLQFGELSVREAAIEALGEEKVERAIPELQRLLSHVLLKKKVMYALQQMGDRKAYLSVLRRKRRDAMIDKERKKIRDSNASRRKGPHAKSR